MSSHDGSPVPAKLSSSAPFEMHRLDRPHRNVRGGGARAAVFGISDGLISNVSLMLGVDGAHSSGAAVRLAGLAGLLAGALSMAAGEYISMRAQEELLSRELLIEQEEIRAHPESEQAELAQIYQRRGIDPDVAARLASEMMATPALALDTHAREEHGIDPDELGSPVQAAVASFASFALGALVPLVPFLTGSGPGSALLAVALSACAAVGIGVMLSVFTGRSWWWSAGRQLAVCGIAASVTFGIGSVVGLGRLG